MEFRVVPVNDAGVGTPSKSTGPHKVRDPVGVAGPPGQPKVDEITPNQVKLSWEKPANDGGDAPKEYIVEKKTKDGDWEPATSFPVKGTEAAVPVKEGEEYQFRVKAVNKAGEGSPSRPTGAVVAEQQPEGPSIDLKGIKDITVKAGQDIKLNIPIKGYPTPVAVWKLEGEEINSPRSKSEVRTCHSPSLSSVVTTYSLRTENLEKFLCRLSIFFCNLLMVKNAIHYVHHRLFTFFLRKKNLSMCKLMFVFFFVKLD